MGDDITNGAISTVVKGFADLGPGGLFSILLFLALVAMYRFFTKEIATQRKEADTRDKESKGDLAKEREAHDKTRQALMIEMEENAQVNAVFRQTIEKQQATFDTLMKVFMKATP